MLIRLFVAPVGGRVCSEVSIPKVSCNKQRALKPLHRLFTGALVRVLLTYARDDVEEIVDLLVHSRGDDFHLWEGVGHRVDAHLRHQQGHQQDLVLLNVVVLHGNGQTVYIKKKKKKWMDGLWVSERGGSPYQQNADGHHGGGAGGHGAVHQNDVIFADVFRQAEVMELKMVVDRMLLNPQH